eukprot:1299654-Rhodomonas_salina.4
MVSWVSTSLRAIHCTPTSVLGTADRAHFHRYLVVGAAFLHNPFLDVRVRPGYLLENAHN